MVTPALRALRRRFPTAEIWAQGRPHLDQLIGGAPLYDRYLPIIKAQRASDSSDSPTLAESGIDLAIVFPHSFRAAFEVFRAGIPLRVGYRREGRGVFFTHSLAPHQCSQPAPLADRAKRQAYQLVEGVSKSLARGWARRAPSLLANVRLSETVIPVPMIEQYLELAAVVGAEGDTEGPTLVVSEELELRARGQLRALGLAEGESYLAVNPGASFGVSKVYPIELLAESMQQLSEKLDRRVLVLCGPGEEPLSSELSDRLGDRAIGSHANLIPLDALKVAIRDASLLVTTDTGPWHIGNAFDTPSVVLMGPTDPRYTRSRWAKSIVLREPVECGPCHKKSCPLEHHRCMRDIPPGRVAAAGLSLLAQG